MGDVAMTVPVISSFARQYPEVKITMLSNSRFEAMFAGIKNLHFIGINTRQEYRGLNGILKLFRELSKHNFDAIIDLHGVLRSNILRLLFKLKGIPAFAIQKDRKGRKALTRQKNKNRIPLKTSFERYYDTFENAGFSFPLNFKSLFPEKAELPAYIQSKLGEKTKKWLAIAPFAQHTGKIYPIEKMEAVVYFFSKREDIQILLFGGGEKEKKILEEWQNKYPHVISLAGIFGLSDELQILNQVDLLISMDSANMHLASLAGTSVVSIWGATHPFAGFYGFNQNPNNIIQLDLSCRPCSIYGNKPCSRKDYVCLNGISPEQIIKKTESVLFENNR